jgi:hypothetical protein
LPLGSAAITTPSSSSSTPTSPRSSQARISDAGHNNRAVTSVHSVTSSTSLLHVLLHCATRSTSHVNVNSGGASTRGFCGPRSVQLVGRSSNQCWR